MADTVGRSAIQNYVDFEKKVKYSMRHSSQRNAGKIRSFFQKDTLKYAAQCRYTFVYILDRERSNCFPLIVKRREIRFHDSIFSVDLRDRADRQARRGIETLPIIASCSKCPDPRSDYRLSPR